MFGFSKKEIFMNTDLELFFRITAAPVSYTHLFKNGYVKNKVMEFVGPGVSSMTTDFRNGVDVMTTETTCLSSIWRTDEDTRDYLAKHHREEDYRQLDPADVAYYDGCVYVDLSTVKPMIALPFHPNKMCIRDRLISGQFPPVFHPSSFSVPASWRCGQ